MFWKCLSKNCRISISLELVSNVRFCVTSPLESEICGVGTQWCVQMFQVIEDHCTEHILFDLLFTYLAPSIVVVPRMCPAHIYYINYQNEIQAIQLLKSS